jgi:GNAT superfamily N-acetyltransferase
MSAAGPQVQWQGYFPGAVGRIVHLHAVYYHDNWGFDITFETQVAREFSEFLCRFDPETDGFWTAHVNGNFAGSVALDGKLASTEGARLRWLIVDPAFHGQGIGSLLVQRTVTFCRQAGHHRIFLWTFQGLAPARRVYEQEGFQLTEEHDILQWGQNIREQKFEWVSGDATK